VGHQNVRPLLWQEPADVYPPAIPLLRDRRPASGNRTGTMTPAVPQSTAPSINHPQAEPRSLFKGSLKHPDRSSVLPFAFSPNMPLQGNIRHAIGPAPPTLMAVPAAQHPSKLPPTSSLNVLAARECHLIPITSTLSPEQAGKPLPSSSRKLRPASGRGGGVPHWRITDSSFGLYGPTFPYTILRRCDPAWSLC
jgi:hypothetical protein